ncbi:MAG TPA: RHS repeat-associated core domain-containing protein [Thermoanaerobaculia bacterium]|nr:RHS repeat-associated core domain-containing protein [Thermoanaerobaculia bacterium]
MRPVSAFRWIVALLFCAIALAAQSQDSKFPKSDSAASGFGAYEYDGSGNIVTAGTDTFVYDKFGRISKATIAGVEQTFRYDRHGNITTIATAGESGGDIAVGADNRLSDATYDGSGNLVSYHGGTFVYDGLNVVTESTPSNGNRRLYLYTASNERLATIEILPNGQQKSEWTLRDPDGRVLRRLAKDANGTWSWKEDYIYRGSLLLAAEVPTPEKVRHFHLDHLGTPRLITGNGGATLAERAYGAFGRGFALSPSDVHEDLEFTGHERDNFQLDYMHARYFDPMWGRFLSADPVLDIDRHRSKPQGWNRYTYVENNPINATDPDGKLIDIVVDAGFIAYDLYDIGRSVWNGQGVSKTQGLSLAANLGAALVPGLTGAGAIVRATSKSDDLGKAAVYVSKNAEDVVQYVGITNNLTRRAAEHAATKGIEITSLKGFEKLGRADARAVEQTLIEIHKLSKDGGTLMNKINSIAKTNKKYAEALERGYKLLNDAGYVIK